MMKHGVDQHAGDEQNTSRYRVKVLEFSRSSFERQISESVHLQNNRQHNLLNSRSEYNRCALPRLTTVLGAKDKHREDEEEKQKEDNVVAKIRQLKKQQSKKGGGRRKT